MSDEPDHRLYAQAKGILQRVFEMRPAERGAYLESACGNSPELRAEVFSLLAAHEQINSQFLDNPFTLPPDADTAAEDRDLSGQRVGAYKLERLLGRGGMGAVYLASRDDGEFTKHVAIKFIRASAASPALLKRFRAERQILADIDHPNIARLIDGGTADGGMPFFIMEYVPGETLTQTLTRGALPLPNAIKLATAVAEVLEAVHAKGLVFRDLKPSNIMLTETSGVKVLDFGIAKITYDVGAERSTSLTEPGWIVGSPRYMSPEQASGEPVDARSDVFSFGVVVFEALTSRLPFNGETRRDYLKNLISTSPEPLPPEIPAALRHVVERCLNKNPADRFASGKELAQAVREAADKPSLGWGLRAAVAILALAVVAVGLWGVLRPKFGYSTLLQGPPQLIATWASNETTPRISPDLRWVSFKSDRDGPDKIILRDRKSGAERTIVPPGGVVLGPHEWSPSSDQIAYVAPRGQQTSLSLAPIDGGKPRTFALRHSDVALVRWIGDGVYYLAESSLWRFDIRSGQPREVTTARGPLRLRGVDVSADERHIVFSAFKDTVVFLWYSGMDASAPTRLTDQRMYPRNMRWRGVQGREVVYVSEEGGMADIWQVDVTTGKRQQLTATETREGPLEVSRDGATLIYEQVREEAHVAILDPSDKAPAVKALTSDTLSDLLPDASTSGKDIVFQRANTIDMTPGIHSATIQLSRDGLAGQSVKLIDGYAPEISADGRWVAYTVWKAMAKAELWLVDAEDGHYMLASDALERISHTAFPLNRNSTNMTWSRSETRLFFLAHSAAGSMEILSAVPARDGRSIDVQPVTNIKDEAATLSDVQVSADGTRLSYLLQSDARAMTELHALNLTRKEDKVYFTETASYRLNCLGWTAGDDSLVVVRGTSDGSRVDVVLVRPGHDAEIARGLKDVSDGSMTLDPRRRVVYFTRQIGAEHTLHALSLDTGVERVLFRGEPHGPSLSGIRVLADGRLLFSFQAQNHDIAAQQYAR